MNVHISAFTVTRIPLYLNSSHISRRPSRILIIKNDHSLLALERKITSVMWQILQSRHIKNVQSKAEQICVTETTDNLKQLH